VAAGSLDVPLGCRDRGGGGLAALGAFVFGVSGGLAGCRVSLPGRAQALPERGYLRPEVVGARDVHVLP
jgi:hypothetical protein